MSKNIKKIITLTLTISAFSVISAITPGVAFDMTTKAVYAASYSPSDGELKSLTVKSTSGDTLDIRDGYNGSTVKLSDDKDYYVKLTDDSDGIKINSKVEGTDYVVRIFTSDKADATPYESGDEILLEKGNTTLYVRTYESDAVFRKSQKTLHDVSICEETYTVNVKKTTASSYEDSTQDPIYLYNLELSKGDISFTKGKTTYDDIKVDANVDHINITAEPEDSNDRVRINESLVDSSDKYKKAVDLENGKNEIKIKVTDSKDNQRTYTLNVTRGSASSSSDDNQAEIYLDTLSLSEGDIDFSREETSYKVDLDESTSNITITAKPEDEEYLVTLNDKELNSGNDYQKKVSLDKGENTVKVVVNDEVNDKKRTYTLTINRGSAQSTDNTDTKDDKSDADTKDTKTETGWVETTDGLKYKDENGKLLENSWLYDKSKGVYYYLNENGIKRTGWIQDKENWYLLDKDGVMLTGWQDINGKRYLMDKNGAMETGWYKAITAQNSTNTTSIENWYYLSDDGSMKTGWFNDGEKWYFLNTNGTMQKGWLINSNSKYYLDEDGEMVTGTKTIDGKEYKFTTSGVLRI